MDWLNAVLRLRREGRPGVLVTVVEVHGHAPRDPGTKMVVGADQLWGSVGGGNLEATAVERAHAMLEHGVATPELSEARLNEHARNEHGRQCCGGVVRLLFEPLAARSTVAVFGVGHVGFELARILSRLELQLQLVDSRAAQLDPLRLVDVTESVADVTIHRAVVPELILERLPRGSHVLIMSHDHAEDFALADASLRLVATDPGRLGTIGLIGSSAKWSRFRRLLVAEGHDPAAPGRITCPIGLPGLPGKDPATIAISVAAALAQVTAPRHFPLPLQTQESAR